MTEYIGSEIENESNAEIAECTVDSVASVNGDGFSVSLDQIELHW